ncbi:hypothetical protein KJ918_06140 [Patescibacteria group bacterium]|nr:hypothetical protein [Patescibacteria group bacterium]
MKQLNTNDLGEKYLVEQCRKIKISEFLLDFKKELKSMVFGSEIDLMGVKIGLITTKPNYGGERIWFECPMCGGRKGVLFKHPISNCVGCRRCLNLEYRKRRYKGMIEEKI